MRHSYSAYCKDQSENEVQTEAVTRSELKACRHLFTKKTEQVICTLQTIYKTGWTLVESSRPLCSLVTEIELGTAELSAADSSPNSLPMPKRQEREDPVIGYTHAKG